MPWTPWAWINLSERLFAVRTVAHMDGVLGSAVVSALHGTQMADQPARRGLPIARRQLLVNAHSADAVRSKAHRSKARHVMTLHNLSLAVRRLSQVMVAGNVISGVHPRRPHPGTPAAASGMSRPHHWRN